MRDHDDRPLDVPQIGALAERMDALAEMSELMGDQAGADGWRERASELRMIAMSLLD